MAIGRLDSVLNVHAGVLSVSSRQPSTTMSAEATFFLLVEQVAFSVPAADCFTHKLEDGAGDRQWGTCSEFPEYRSGPEQSNKI